MSAGSDKYLFDGYHYLLALLSLSAAILGMYMAFDAAGHVTTTRLSRSRWWLAGVVPVLGMAAWACGVGGSWPILLVLVVTLSVLAIAQVVSMFDMQSSMNDDMHANVHENLHLLQDLRQALDRGELTLHYQPKFTAPSGPIVGVEALLRWKHPRLGMVSPGSFIPLAEKVGLIVPIGDWVLDEACRQMAQWRRDGYAPWTVAVNLSAVQFNHAALIETVRDALLRHALGPESLVLEITESTAMRDTAASARVLEQLHDMGVGISIDDFGTGYSSLLYLKRLPASELKIDRGFINDLSHDAEDAAIVSAIIALGKTLDLKIVAEGVETEDQQAFLTRIGCNALQGFLLGRPMPAEDLLHTLRQEAVAAG
jgi:EAL domain-containing protein (putative c-di-GMP-specific phosphodiesterase class I)